MSGGRYDYFYQQIQDFADSLRIECDFGEYSSPTLRKAFRRQLYAVARAARAIEWNDSGDGDSEEIALIEQCLGKVGTKQAHIEEAKEAVDYCVRAVETLRKVLG